MGCGFAWDNKWDSGNLTTSGNAVNFPANNTRHRWHQKHWRSANLADPEWLKVDAGNNGVDVDMAILKYTNFQANAAVWIQANDSDNWAMPDFSLQFTPINTDVMAVVANNTERNQWWRLIITDATNPANYVSVGRFYIGPVFKPTRNYILGGGMRADIDPSVMGESDDGQASAILKTHYRHGDFSFERIAAADKGQFENLYNNVGVAKPFFFCQNMNDAANYTWYVYISEFDIQPEYNSRFTVRLSLREAR